MKKFAVQITGDNFLVSIEGKKGKFSFIQVHYVEAENPSLAEAKAIESVRGDSDLRSLVKNAQEDPPVLNTDKVEEMLSFEGIEALVSGRAWYEPEPIENKV